MEPPKTESYSTEDGHFIKTFLISTKPNQAHWQISKATGHDKVKSFIGKPFTIVPEHLSDKRQRGHLFADSRDELLKAYENHAHGTIQSISEPFNYNDGTDDYFYMANIKLSGSKAASALMEHGPKTWIPFSVSPHIWSKRNDTDIEDDWEGIALCLVGHDKIGAYGTDAVVTKYCHGETDSCVKSLAASSLCKVEDESLAASISSTISLIDNKDIMSQVQEVKPKEFTPNQVNQIPAQAQEEVKKEDTISLTKAEFEALNKEVQAKKAAEEQVTRLVTKDKTNTLNTIFESVKDDTVKNQLVEKYLNHDTDILNEFTKDYNTHVLPSKLEAQKAQAEQDLKNKLVDDNKGKSKAAALPKEPVVQEENKAASIVPKTHNEVKEFDRLMRGQY